MQLEWLILADSAQVAEGKLFLLGGGWDLLGVTHAFPVQKHLAIAASFLVAWDEMNRTHLIELAVTDDAGHELARSGGQVEVGRPAGVPLTHAQRHQVAVEATVTFEHAGSYAIFARIGAEEAGRVPFSVIALPGTPGAPPPGPAR